MNFRIFRDSFIWKNRSTVGQPLRLPTTVAAGDAPALQSIHDFSQKLRAAVNETGVKLNQLCARLKFFARRFAVENSSRSNHWNCGSSSNFTQQCSRLASKWRSAQPACLI